MGINNLVVVSDLHCGCQFGLCPPTVRLDGGGVYVASRFQKMLWEFWEMFWGEWVPLVTRGEPFAVCINGDTTDGAGHHGSITQVSQNLSDQRRIAKEVLQPIVEACGGRFYMVRGTEAHVGQSGQHEETLAEELGAIPDDAGIHARYELWAEVGECLAHIMHHVGTTGSMAYETTALMKEFSESCAEAGRWKLRAPNVVVRSHRHRHSEIKVPTEEGYGVCFTTAGWQLKTPFVWKIPGGRISTPQIGGSLIRQGDEEFFTRHRTWNIPRAKTVQLIERI